MTAGRRVEAKCKKERKKPRAGNTRQEQSGGRAAAVFAHLDYSVPSSVRLPKTGLL